MIREAAERIQDIANNLIAERKCQDGVSVGDGTVNEDDAVKLETVLIPALVESAVSQKRLEVRSRLSVSIQMELDPACYGLFGMVERREFKNALSNVMNNAVEAIKENGVVRLSLVKKENTLEIQITDNGIGIHPDDLPRLMQEGVSFGKPNGHGKGLFLAKTTMERLGGGVFIKSELGKGTQVTLSLPDCPPPLWFVPEIRLDAGATVVILDDDVSIHHIWDARFRSLQLEKNGNEVVHLSRGDELVKWCSDPRDRKKPTLFLMDQELLGQKCTGLQLIEQLGSMNESILVTSRYDEENVLEEVKRIGIKLIPKGSARFVPIRLSEKTDTSLDGVLIDDCEMTRFSWQSSAELYKKKLLVFETQEEFFANECRIGFATPIYIDVNLGDKVDGRDVAKRVHYAGFRKIILATGMRTEDVKPPDCVSEIVGKQPPWLTG